MLCVITGSLLGPYLNMIITNAYGGFYYNKNVIKMYPTRTQINPLYLETISYVIGRKPNSCISSLFQDEWALFGFRV